MQAVVFEPTFEDWRAKACAALRAERSPDSVAWEVSGDEQCSLFAEERSPAGKREVRVPPAFLALARRVACHRSPERWALLYRVLWRLLHGEPQLLAITVDDDISRLFQMDKTVRREVHKMRAFVRFREVEGSAPPAFVAWFEPEHPIVELNAPFFIDRFATMRWSILTPDKCAHWDGSELSFTPGVARALGDDDRVEDLWRTYYANIFNPARLKLNAMRAEMPKRYWANLPEAELITPLIQEASLRVDQMMISSERKSVPDDEHGVPEIPPGADLAALRERAATCTACPLYRQATQTVFGEGVPDAEIVLVGEQPGDQEDREGHPFVGPAGRLLDRALADAGLDRERCYVTNVVKHFKWEPRGKRRLHQKPSERDVASCRPWLEAELHALQPKKLVLLGATAARFAYGATVRIERDRGVIAPSPFCAATLITTHPSALLRNPDPTTKEEEYQRFVADLRLACAHS